MCLLQPEVLGQVLLHRAAAKVRVHSAPGVTSKASHSWTLASSWCRA